MSAVLTARMRVVCCYCDCDMGDKPCTQEMATFVSHGSCIPCLAAEFGEEFAEMVQAKMRAEIAAKQILAA